jgi:hypothetical protein
MALRVLGETTGILCRDLTIGVEELFQVLKAASEGEPQLGDFNFRLKSSIRSLFGLAEVVSNSLAAAILQSGFSLNGPDRAVLTESDYDAERDIFLGSRRYPLGLRLQVCFQFFPIICGASPLPSWDPAVKHDFIRVTRARNRFTHPTRLEDLHPFPVFESFRQIAL